MSYSPDQEWCANTGDNGVRTEMTMKRIANLCAIGFPEKFSFKSQSVQAFSAIAVTPNGVTSEESINWDFLED